MGHKVFPHENAQKPAPLSRKIMEMMQREYKPGDTFFSADITGYFGLKKDGPVTGFISHLRNVGAIKVVNEKALRVGSKMPSYLYEVVDLGELAGGRGSGGAKPQMSTDVPDQAQAVVDEPLVPTALIEDQPASLQHSNPSDPLQFITLMLADRMHDIVAQATKLAEEMVSLSAAIEQRENERVIKNLPTEDLLDEVRRRMEASRA